MLLCVLSMIRCVFTIIHFHLVYDFVKSRPPGRKMVKMFNFLSLIWLSAFLGHIWYQCLCNILQWYRWGCILLWIWTRAVNVSAIFTITLEAFCSSFDYLPSSVIFMFTQVNIIIRSPSMHNNNLLRFTLPVLFFSLESSTSPLSSNSASLQIKAWLVKCLMKTLSKYQKLEFLHMLSWMFMRIFW